MAESGLRAALAIALVWALSACGGGGDALSDDGAGAAPDGEGSVGAATFRLGGSASGVGGSGLILLNNGVERLTVPADGSFTFAGLLASGASFSVSIAAEPAGQLCSVTGGSGSIGNGDANGIGVSCRTVTAVTGGGGGGGGGAGPAPAVAASGKPGSADLIRDALAAGTLGPEQALIYEMFAEYDDPRLPAQYRGDDGAMVEGVAHGKVLEHIATVGLANVSPATLETLKPFFVPSYLEGSHRQQSVDSDRKAALARVQPGGVKAGWTSVGGTNVVVWYETSRAASDAANAAMLVAEFDGTIWPKLTALMGRTPKSDLGTALWTETDGRLDVVLDDLKPGKHGVTTPTSFIAKDTATKMQLSRNLPPHGLRAVAAHEFMHAIQFSIDVKAHSLHRYGTIREATASWASHYVYPAIGWEASYAQHYLTGKNLGMAYDAPTASTEGANLLFRYGAYVLPLYLETQFGPGIVKDIWDRTVGDTFELDVIDKAIVGKGSTFAEQWRKFIAFSWNQETLNAATRFYKAGGVTFTTAPAKPNDDFQDETLALSGGFGQVAHTIDLPRASMSFHRVRFAGTDSRSVTFVNGINFRFDTFDSGVGNALRFTGQQPGEREGVSMQLYLKVAGAWQSEPVDVTNVPWIAICRDNPAGKVEEVVFMYGNAGIARGSPNYNGLKVRGALEPGLIATDIGCGDWQGTLDMTRPVDVGTGSETFRLKNVKLVNALTTAAPQPGAILPYPLAAGDSVQPGFGFVYNVTGGTAEWTYDQRTTGPTTCDYTGSGSYPVTGRPGPGPGRIPVLTLGNYAPPGNTARSLITPGLAVNALADFVSLKAEWRCTDRDGKVTTGTSPGIAAPLDLLVHELMQSARVKAGGLLISGTGAETQAVENGDSTVTGTWSLKAVP